MFPGSSRMEVVRKLEGPPQRVRIFAESQLAKWPRRHERLSLSLIIHNPNTPHMI